MTNVKMLVILSCAGYKEAVSQRCMEVEVQLARSISWRAIWQHVTTENALIILLRGFPNNFSYRNLCTCGEWNMH